MIRPILRFLSLMLLVIVVVWIISLQVNIPPWKTNRFQNDVTSTTTAVDHYTYYVSSNHSSRITTAEATTTSSSSSSSFMGNLSYYHGQKHSIQYDNLTRYFIDHTPNTIQYDSNNMTSPPLLILLHWGRGNMQASAGFGRLYEKDPWLYLAYQYKFVIICPNGTHKRFLRNQQPPNTNGYRQNWHDLLGGGASNTSTDDVGFIVSLIDWAIEYRNINPKRIYLTGMSNGGMMTQRLIIEHPELFAAASTVGASLPNRDVPLPIVGTPIVMFHGNLDMGVPWNGGPVTEDRGIVRSAEATRDYFVTSNGAGPDMIETWLPDIDPNDDCRIVSQYYHHETYPVQFYRMDGGGHMVPAPKLDSNMLQTIFESLTGNLCHDVSGIQLAWEFMSQYERIV